MKSDVEVTYMMSHVESKIWYNWTHLQNRLINIENKLIVAKGEVRGQQMQTIIHGADKQGPTV